MTAYWVPAVDPATKRFRSDIESALAVEVVAPAAVAAAATKVNKGDLMVSVADHNPVGNGTTPDDAAVQAAASAAAAAGKALYIPGTYRITTRIDVSTPIVCDGAIMINTSDTSAEIRIVRTATPVTVTAGGLGGLTVGSTNITGLSGQKGTLNLQSSDHLIERNNGVGQYYLKAETSEVVNESGDIMPALDNAYSTGTLTATLYPYEPTITVDRLRILLSGSGSPAGDHYLGIYRSNVELNDPQIYNTTTQQPVSGIRVQTATNVTINRPMIHGFDQSGAGYGIAAFDIADLRVNGGRVTRCRHTITGRNTKGITVDGGTYDGGFDTHWGSNYRLLNLVSNVGPSLSHLAVAGKDVVVQNCQLNGGRAIVGIRNDTPELDGSVTVENVRWDTRNTTGAGYIVGHTSAAQTFFDHGRTVKKPVRTVIRKVDVTMAGLSSLSAVYSSGHNYPQTYFGEIDISGIRVRDTAGAETFWIAALIDKDSSNHPADTRGSIITVRDAQFTTSTNDNIVIQNTGDITDSLGFTLTMVDCTGVHLQLPENGMNAVVLKDCELLRLRPVAVSANPFTGGYLLDGCTINAAAFTGVFKMDFRSCTWVGTSTTATLTMDQRARSYRGCLKAVGASGFPTVADGYLDSAVYQSPVIDVGGGVTIRAGAGDPNSVVTALPGSVFLRTDGGSGTGIYVKDIGSGNTGWVPRTADNYVASNISTNFAVNCSTAHVTNLTLQGNYTMTAFSNGRVGQTQILMLTQDATGSRTVTWPATIKWAGGTPPTLSTVPGKTDVFQFVFCNDGFWRELSRSVGA